MARNRKLNRLKDYDYSQAGYYYVTVCTKDRHECLGEIKDGAMIFNECGESVDRYWAQIPRHYGNVTLDEFVVMPNHVHGIILIDRDCRDSTMCCPYEELRKLRRITID